MLPGVVASDSDLWPSCWRASALPPAHDGADEDGAEPPTAATLGGGPLEAALRSVLPILEGAFSLRAHRRHPRLSGSATPTVSGRCAWVAWARPSAPEGWVLASETPALDIIGATFVRELEPGELVVSTSDGVRSVPALPRASGSTPTCASSSSSTSPGPTASCTATRCTGPAGGWASCWPPRPRWRPTWSWACPNRGCPRPRASPGPAASPTARGW